MDGWMDDGCVVAVLLLIVFNTIYLCCFFIFS